MERVPTMPVTNSDNTGPSETEDEELTGDQGVENVRPEESSLRPVDHHTISDNNHHGHQQQYQPEQIVNDSAPCQNPPQANTPAGLRSQDTSTDSNLSAPEADGMNQQFSSAENEQQTPNGGHVQVLATTRHPSLTQDGDRQTAHNQTQNQPPSRDSEEITMNGHAAIPDPHAETNNANPVVLAGIANGSVSHPTNDRRAPSPPDAMNAMDVIRMFQVQGEAAILEEELSLLNRLRELRRRRGADDYSGFHKRGFGG